MKDRSGDMWSVVAVVLAIIVVVWWIYDQQSQKTACRARGGIVLDVRGTDDLDGWVCQEPR